MSNELQTPVQIDTAIAAQLFAVAKADRNLDALERQTWMSDWEDKYADAIRVMEDEHAKLDGLQDLYTGWTRYWHVTNVNGHIHTSQHCTSCFPDTTYAWRTDLSGLTVEEVVEREAYDACTVCMPIAPAEQKAAREYHTKQERERRAAEKAQAKREKELAKVPRAQVLATKVNELLDTFGADKHGETGAYRATYDESGPHGKRFIKGYDSAYFVYSDLLEQRQRRQGR